MMNPGQPRDSRGGPPPVYRWVVIGLLVVAVGAAMLFRPGAEESSDGDVAIVATALEAEAAAQLMEPAAGAETTLPRLVDLGADKCIPCKMMAPILEQLREDFVGRFDVVFIDVWKNRDQAKEYGIRVIPTQIFYDRSGQEIFRHEGFFSREDILGVWQKHGIGFDGEPGRGEAS